MLFATNGSVQHLPADTKFVFWDAQVDWGRAFKAAKVQQQAVVGVGASPAQEFMVHLLLEATASDPYKVFTSRPAGQATDWKQWARFAYWFFGLNYGSKEKVMNDIRWGNVGRWFGQFTAANVMAQSEHCFASNASVDAIVFWDFHPWDGQRCMSERQLPAQWPTPEEMAHIQETVAWLNDTFGTSRANKFMNDPPQASDHAQNVMQNASAPPPLEDAPVDAREDESSNLVPIAAATTAVVLGWLILRSFK